MRRPGVFVLASLVTLGCADLPSIELGVCGNGVAEPTRGEDCDGESSTGTTCAAPGTAHECRYLCEGAPEGCAKGFACGQDGVCRAPAGRWLPATAASLRPAESLLDLAIADADGDRRGEVFLQGPNSVWVHYDAISTTPTSRSLARDAFLPAVGPVADLSGDELADVVIPSGLGYFVSLGDRGRVERATAYGALRLPDGVSQVHALSAEILPDEPGSEVMVLAIAPGVNAPPSPGLVHIAASGAYTFIAALPDEPDRLAGPVKPGRLDEDETTTPCDELVFAYGGSSTLDLLVPCAVNHGVAGLAVGAEFTPVRLPAGAVVAGPVEIEDLDRDGHLDLVVVALRGDVHELEVAYGRGDGTFDSVPRSGASTPPDGALGVGVVVDSGFPLAVGDLDGDARPDWVDATGVHLARAGGSVLAASNPGAAWTSALIGRFDGDQLPDVAVGSDRAPGVFVYLNAGRGDLTGFSVATRGHTSMLASGDFDGDRITDIVVVNTTRVSDSDAVPDTLSIAFGSPFGAPSEPKDVGEFHRIHQLATAHVAAGDMSVVDGADDLGALAEGEDRSLAYVVLLGQGDRELRSPFALTRTDVTLETVVAYAPLRLTVGDVDGDEHPDVVALAPRIDGVPELTIASSPMYGQASIRLGNATFSGPLDMSFDWDHVLFGAVDLDGVPGDEIVALGPRAGGSGHQVAVAHADPSEAARTFVLGAPVAVDGVFTRTEAPRADTMALNGRLRFADLDGDGARDVLALGERDARGELVVYFNDGTGELGAPARVPGTEALDVRDFAVTGTDAEAGAEAVLFTTTGIYTVGGHRRTLTLGPPQLAGRGAASGSAALIDAGDVDGDGIPDLVLAGPDGVEVHRGVSKNPRDAR